MALATADQLKTFNQRIANGKTGQKYMNKNNFYVGSSADNATAATQDQLNEYYKRVRAGHDGQQYLTKNNIYIGNRGTTPTTTAGTTTGTTAGTTPTMTQDYYDMVFGYEIPKQDTSYQNTYRNDMNNINYNPAQINDSWSKNYNNAVNNVNYDNSNVKQTYNNALNNVNYDNSNVKQTYNNALNNVDYNTAKINEDYYNKYKNDLANISGLANIDTLYDWRRNQATDAAQKYMASLGLAGSGAEAQAVTDAVNKVTSEDARRYEELYMQEAQRLTDAANQLANQGYNLYNANAGYENAMNQLRAQNQSQAARDLAEYDNDMNKLRVQNQSQAARDLAGYDNEMNQLRAQNQFNAATNLLNAETDRANINGQFQNSANQAYWSNQANMAANLAGFNQNAASNYQNLESQRLGQNADRYYNMTEAQSEKDYKTQQANISNLLNKYQLLLNAAAAGLDVSKEEDKLRAQILSLIA